MNFRKTSEIKLNWRDFRALQKRLYQHAYILSSEIGPRNALYHSALSKAHQYIVSQMANYNANLSIQQFKYRKKPFHNIIAEKIGSRPEEIFIIGAHFDSAEDSPGADDNATGIACLLELIDLLQLYNNKRTIRFVAFALEEPPLFGTEYMGSHVYARSCHAKAENVVGMIALEMLGFYTEKRKSQQYPLPDMKGRYSDRGNFIAIVGNERSHQLTNHVATYVSRPALINTQSIISTSIYGIDLSDHSSFWKYNYPAIMITDTAFYRNPNYHSTSDTIDTINFRYFTRLVYSLAYALKKLDQQDMI